MTATYILELEYTELPLVLNETYPLRVLGYIFDDTPEELKYYITIEEVDYIIGEYILSTNFEIN